MSKRLHGFVIDPTKAVKNDEGDIVISYADIDFTGRPIVFVTPYSPSGDAPFIPTVIRVGKTHISIRDKNTSPGYMLHVVLADPNLNPLQDKMHASSLNKTQPGVLRFENESLGINDYTFHFLTPYWKDQETTYVSGVETMYQSKNTQPGPLLELASRNASSNYFVNHLFVSGKSDHGITGSFLTSKGTQFRNSYNFEKYKWDHKPCILLTPWARISGTYFAKQPILTNVGQQDFSITCDHQIEGSFVNFLAVQRDIPRYSHNSLDGAFAHIFEHFPEHSVHINRFREEFENIILRGAEPSEELKAHQFDISLPPIRTKSMPPEEEIAIAKVCFDAISLLVNIATGIKSSLNNAVIRRLNAEIQNAGPAAAEILDEVNETVNLLAKDPNLELKTLKKLAFKLKVLAGAMFSAGIIKVVLLSILADLFSSTYKLILAIITILAQILALIASGGAELLAWIGRIIAYVSSGGTLVADSLELYRLQNGKA